MKFTKLVLKHDPLYGSARLDIEPGLTVVYGLNRVTKNSRNGNFAGKSYLLSQIPETIWDSPVIGTREDKNLVGTRELHVRVKGHDYKFIKGKKLQVYENGKLLFKGVKETRQWINALPINEQEFLGLYYLDSRRNHPLVMGTSSERSAYLTRFFNLNRIDEERKKINAKLNELKTYRAQLLEVETSLRSLRENKPKKAHGDIETLKDRQATLQQLQNKFLLMQRARDFAMSVRPQMQLLQDAVDFNALTTAQLKAVIVNTKVAIEDDTALLHDAERWSIHKKQEAAYQSATENLTKHQLRALDNRKVYRKAYLNYKALKQNLVPLPGKPTKPTNVPAPTADLEKLRDKYRKYEHEYNDATKFKSGKCPMCGSSVKVRPLREIKSDLLRYKSRYAKACAAQETYDAYRRAYEQYKARLSSWQSLKANHGVIKNRLDKLRAKAKTYRTIKDVPNAPPEFTGQRVALDVTQKMVARDHEVLAAARQLIPNVKLLRHIVKTYPDVTPKLDKLNTRISTYQLARSEYKRYRIQLKSLLHRQAKLQSHLSDAPALELLAKAYNDKGMKHMAIEAACKMLAQQLNKYSAIAFPDRYTFSIAWTKSKLSFLCTRPNGRTTDVRKLSGAESRLFTYLLVFAQLHFIPKNRRSNLMVLDEPTTNMHEETVEAFKRLLELMRSIIPSIVVITPQMDHYENARALTIVRDKGKSRIVEGIPSSVV